MQVLRRASRSSPSRNPFGLRLRFHGQETAGRGPDADNAAGARTERFGSAPVEELPRRLAPRSVEVALPGDEPLPRVAETRPMPPRQQSPNDWHTCIQIPDELSVEHHLRFEYKGPRFQCSDNAVKIRTKVENKAARFRELSAA